MDHSTAHLGVSVYVRVAGSRRLGVEPFPQPPEGLLDPSTGGGRHHPDLLPPYPRSAESVSPASMGLAVDYLTRLDQGAAPESAFSISLRGARNLGEDRRAEELLARVARGGAEGVAAAFALSSYDQAYRRGPAFFKGEGRVPNGAALENVAAMRRYMGRFFDAYGPMVWDGPTFDGAHTACVSAGDADFVCGDTLWDMKVSSYGATALQTLQLLVYWRLGMHSDRAAFWEGVRHVGIVNPRRATTRRWDLDRVPEGTVETIDRELIGYGVSPVVG